jgi:PAS domain S-box-containing protein
MTLIDQIWNGDDDAAKPTNHHPEDFSTPSIWRTDTVLRQFLESAPIAIVATDQGGRIVYVNARLEEMFGYDPHELLDKRVEALIPERYRSIHIEHRSRYLESPHVRGMGSGMELVGRRRNGVEFPIEAGLSYIQTDTDMLIVNSITDISRRKQTEEMLEARVQERTRELERRRRVSEGLRDTLAILNSNRSQTEILDYIVTQACCLLYADASAIYSVDPNSQSLVMQANHGLMSGNRQQEQSAFDFAKVTNDDPESGADSAPCDEDQRMHIVTVERPDDDDQADIYQAGKYRAVLSVPLVVKGAIYGNLILYYTAPRKFSPEEIELAMTVGDQAALAIENARLRTQVERAAVAAERNRIARDLHDSVTQTLFSATLITEVLPKVMRNNPVESERLLGELRQLTRGALAEMRTLLLELRPAALGDVEIDELLRQLTEGVIGRARMPITLAIECDCSLPPDVKTAYYHVAQEALNNVAKHARATQAQVFLQGDPHQVTLSISDDGRGFVLDEVTSEHLGLGIMRERAEDIDATLAIKSQVGVGTEVTITWTRSSV